MTEVRDLFSGEPSMVPGELRGYRRWRGILLDGELVSTGVDYSWEARKRVHVAECMGVYYNTGEHGPSPSKNCQCGFYGWYDPNDSRIPLGGASGAIFGVIKATGHIVLGSHGFRAEKVEVVAVTASGSGERLILRDHGYKVLSTENELVAAYPTEDVSGLTGHTCDGDCVSEVDDPLNRWPYGASGCTCPGCTSFTASQQPPVQYQAGRVRYVLSPPIGSWTTYLNPDPDLRQAVIDARKTRNTGPAKKPTLRDRLNEK